MVARVPMGARATASRSRKTGLPPGLPYKGATRHRTRMCLRSLARTEAEIETTTRSAATLQLRRNAAASVALPGAGDGVRPENDHLALDPQGPAMSHAAIAAVLARTDLAAGERLVALSLASFANREQRAWPGNPAGAARAGLGRSRYLEVRDQLVGRGLLELENRGRGRGQATMIALLFAQSGPWWDAEMNAQLLEGVLGHSRARGPTRLLLAALASLSDDTGAVDELSTEALCRAAGLADSTYRRARAALLASGEVELVEDGGGRGRTNRWHVVDPDGSVGVPAVTSRRRRTAGPNARPLLSPVRPEARRDAAFAEAEVAARAVSKGPFVTGVSDQKRPVLTEVSGGKGLSLTRGVSPEKGPALTGLYAGNTADTPPETPPPNTRAGREPLNPRVRNPPNPPEGGRDQAGHLFIEETYRTPRGRRRRRQVAVDLAALCSGLVAPSAVDRRDWLRIRELLALRLGESMFKIWLGAIELRAVDTDGSLILVAPDPTMEWVRERYGRLIADAAEQLGHQAAIADAARAAAIVATDLSCDPSADTSYDTSACELSDPSADNPAKEVRSW